MSFTPIPLTKKKRSPWWLAGIAVAVLLVAGYFLYRAFFSSPGSARWAKLALYRANPDILAQYVIQPGQRCGDAPFAFPTTGVPFGLWDQSYRLGHRHQGIDIFPGTELGVTPVYAAYPGYLSRLPDWRASVIIRLPSDPLEPGRQIWTYYTHMADEQGNSFISEAFPPGTGEVYVEAGTFLGYQGDYSGDPDNPTGLHLHFSVVKDDGSGQFLNELDINNTLDPSPYFNLALNYNENPDDFPVCQDEVTFEDWDLLPEGE
jgi:murein DD-endopeptidase MepM/ murein hydrolase activator NlpD